MRIEKELKNTANEVVNLRMIFHGVDIGLLIALGH